MIKPVGKFVILRMQRDENKKGSLILVTEKEARFFIHASNNPETYPIGAEVIIAKYSMTEFTVGDETFYSVIEDNVMGILE